MFTVYKPKKISKNHWTLAHPDDSKQMIGHFKTQKAANEYVIKTMSAIINR